MTNTAEVNELELFRAKLAEVLATGFPRRISSGIECGDYTVSVVQRGRVEVARKFSSQSAVFCVSMTLRALDALVSELSVAVQAPAPDFDALPFPATEMMRLDWHLLSNLFAAVALATALLVLL